MTSTVGSSATYWRQIDRRLRVADPATLGGAFSAGRSRSDGQSTGRVNAGPVPLRLLPDTAEVAPDDSLSIGGVDVATLAEAVGTPVFIYDEAHLRSRCREAHRVFGDGVSFASKAFLCRAMARLAHDEGMMIDAQCGAGPIAAATRWPERTALSMYPAKVSVCSPANQMARCGWRSSGQNRVSWPGA